MNLSIFQQQIQTHASNWVRDQLLRNPDLLLFTQHTALPTPSDAWQSHFIVLRKTLLNHRYAILQPEEWALYFASPSVLGELRFPDSDLNERAPTADLTLHATQPRQAELALKLLRRVKGRALGSSVE